MKTKTIMSAALCCALLLGCKNGDSGVRAEPRPSQPSQKRVIGEYLLTPAAGYSQEQFLAAAQKALSPYGVQSVEMLSMGLLRVKLAKDPGPEAISAALASAPQIKDVQPNYVYRAFDNRPGAPK